MPLSSAEKSKRYRDKLKKCNPLKYQAIKKNNLERAKRAYRAKIGAMSEEQQEHKAENHLLKQMPLSAAEKSKRYRDKLKNCNPSKYQAYKKKNLERSMRYYRAKIGAMSEEQKEEQRAKWRAQNMRRNLKIEPDDTEQPATSSYLNDTSQNDMTRKDNYQNQNYQRRMERSLQNDNAKLHDDNVKLHNVLQNLKKGYNRLNRTVQTQQKQLDKLNQKYEDILKKLQEIPVSCVIENCVSDSLVEVVPHNKSDIYILP